MRTNSGSSMKWYSPLTGIYLTPKQGKWFGLAHFLLVSALAFTIFLDEADRMTGFWQVFLVTIFLISAACYGMGFRLMWKWFHGGENC